MDDIIDLTRAPRGELVAASLVKAVARVGDLAERHYLEIKGELDLTSKRNKAKIAKFILGAANRMPDVAAAAFEGYAVMIIGVSEDSIDGVEPIEMMELSKAIQPFLGVSGPHWDLVRVPVDATTKQVLVILVDPPQMGQDPFLCRANGDGIFDGRVYIRAEGATREANSEELALLLERGKFVPSAPVELAVDLIGGIKPVAVDEFQTLEEYISKIRSQLMNAIPVTKEERLLISMDMIKLFGTFSEPEKRTRGEYEAEIAEWEQQFRDTWPAAVQRFISYTFAPTEVRISNSTRTYLQDVQMDLHLEGPVKFIDYSKSPEEMSLQDLDLPLSPRKWGPKANSFDPSSLIYSQAYSFSSSMPRSMVPSNTIWKNSGSVDVNISVGDLRPEAVFESNDHESILIIQGDYPDIIEGTWKATVKNRDDVYSGKIQIKTDPVYDLTEPIKHVMGLT